MGAVFTTRVGTSQAAPRNAPALSGRGTPWYIDELMKHRITLFSGDGIGPEVSSATIRVIEAAGVDIEWEPHIVGIQAVERSGSTLPDVAVDSARRNRVALKGPVTTPVGTGFESVNVRLRKKLDLYANVRPVRSLPGVPSPFSDVDLVIVRENTEGLYSGLEHEVVTGVVESLKIVTERASTRIARYAFEYARRHGRKKVTTIHKANILKKSDGLFLECVRQVGLEYPEIERDEKIVDNACMQLVINPSQFDVLLTENLYGDIVSDLAAGLVGGLGVVPGSNIGEEAAVFEAVHGSAPDIAGKNLANPTALLLSACLMLEHIGESGAAGRIRIGIEQVLRKGLTLTRDLGGSASTLRFADAIIEEISS